MSVMSILQPSPTAVQVRPRQAASDLDAVRSSGWLDSTAASYEVAKDEVPAVQDARLLEAYIPVRRAVAEAMGKSPVFGYFSATNSALAMLPFTSNDTNDNDALWEDILTLRRQGKLPAGIPTDRAKFESEILTRGGQRTVDQIKAAQGTFTSRLIGGVGATFNDPVQVVVTLATGGASRGMTVGRSILMEGLLNSGAAAVEMPLTVQARAALGETTTASDVVAELSTAFAFGAVADLGMRGVSAGWSAGKSALAIPERANPIKVAKAFAKAVPEAMRTPEQQAALHVIEREASLAESAPKGASAPEVNAHLARLDAAQRALVEEGRQAGARGFARAVDVQDGREAQAAFKAQAAVAESGGNDLAKAATSSAYGRYQFIKSTWESYYVRRFGRQGLTAEQIAAKRADPALQEQLMDDLTADNAAQLRKIGAPVTKANLYLAHLLGPRDADKVLRAAPDTPLEGLISARSIAANKSFMAGRKVADIIAFSERKMKAAPGTGGGAGMAPEPFEGTMADVVPPERAAALTAERPDVPEMARADMPVQDETSWRIEYAAREAEQLGLPEPAITRQSVWLDAREQLMAARGGEVRGALYHPETGPIDVKWGDANAGLAKMVERHGEVLDNLPELIAQMTVESRSPNRIRLMSADHRAVVRLDYDGQQQTWLLTAFQIKGKTPKPAEDGRAGIGGLDGSPTLGDVYNLALTQAGIKSDGIGPGATWAMQAERGEKLRPVHGVFDSAGMMRSWSTSVKDARRIAERMGGQTEGMAVRRIDAPDLRQDVLPLPDAVAERFSDPASADVKAQAESFTHDVAAARDAGLYRDVTFETGAPAPETAEQALARLDDEDAALTAMRGCL